MLNQNYTIKNLQEIAIELLKKLISIESFSQHESNTALLLEEFFTLHHIPTQRHLNNIICQNHFFDTQKPCILLNSHHDTVQPNKAYTLNPFMPIEKDDKLFGLGSTDAGGSLVALIATFLYFNKKTNLPYNIILALSAEEEISGRNGIESILPLLPKNIEFGLVGEPTQMELAIAEKGLMVIDCVSKGLSGHAAREEGVNAILEALADIQWFSTYRFPKISSYLGENKMSVTIINAGSQHNIIPSECRFTVDIRLNDLYHHNDVLEIISQHTKCKIVPRSMRLKSTRIDEKHPLIQAGLALGKKTYGSPTTSDKALLPFPALKCGPGFSAQSHSADEFIFIKDIHQGIQDYIALFNLFFENLNKTVQEH